MRVTEMTNPTQLHPIDPAPSFQGWRCLVGAGAAPTRWIFASWVDRFPGVEVEAEARFSAKGGPVTAWAYRAYDGSWQSPSRPTLAECLADVTVRYRD